MNPRSRRIVIALLVLGVVLAGALFYRTFTSATQPSDIKPYDVAPPTSFVNAKNPSIIDADKLTGPIIGDELFAQLQRESREDFAQYSALALTYEEVTRLVDGDREVADQVQSALAGAYPAVEGRTATLKDVTIKGVTPEAARMVLTAVYQGDVSDRTITIPFEATYDITEDRPILAGLTAPVGG